MVRLAEAAQKATWLIPASAEPPQLDGQSALLWAWDGRLGSTEQNQVGWWLRGLGALCARREGGIDSLRSGLRPVAFGDVLRRPVAGSLNRWVRMKPPSPPDADIKKAPLGALLVRVWRRGWDSNPRRTQILGGFQDRCIRPLCHLSDGRQSYLRRFRSQRSRVNKAAITV